MNPKYKQELQLDWGRQPAPAKGWQGKTYKQAYAEWSIVWGQKIPKVTPETVYEWEIAHAAKLHELHSYGWNRDTRWLYALAAYHSLLDCYADFRGWGDGGKWGVA